MARSISRAKRERFNYKDATFHITVRCNNKRRRIKTQVDFKKYRFILRKCKEKHGFLLHNYVIMQSHLHLIIRLKSTLDISTIMHSINRWYARWYNEYYNRSGHFWEDRFYANLIEDDLQLLAVMRYIDLNPVRAGLCKKPEKWTYSGAGFYLKGMEDTLLDAPEVYLGLGNSREERHQAYSFIFPINLKNPNS